MPATIELIGSHIENSVSPQMMNAGLGALGISQERYQARLIPPNDDQRQMTQTLDRYLAEAGSRGIQTVAVTMPFKQLIYDCDAVRTNDETVLATGTVNMLKRDGELWQAYNTDRVGIQQALRAHNVEVEDQQVVIFGDGATAMTATEAIGGMYAENILIVGRNPLRRELIRQRIMGRKPRLTVEHCDFTDYNRFAHRLFALAVNATSVGQKGTVEEGNNIASGLDVIAAARFDVVYNPLETPFLASGRRLGAVAVHGLDMLVHQGVEQLRLMTDIESDGMFHRHLTEQMTQAAMRALQQF